MYEGGTILSVIILRSFVMHFGFPNPSACVDYVWLELFDRGTWVQLMDLEDAKRKVATGRIIGLPRIDYYHGVTIDEKFYSVAVKEALDGKVELFVSNEVNDPPRVILKDVVGTTSQ
jgi:hypothetical protein